MGYYNGTILLKRTHSTVQVERLLGVPIDLNQVSDAICGLEQFLASQQDDQVAASAWEQGVLITPSDEQFQKSSSGDKERWGRHFETEGRLPPPSVHISNAYWQEKKMLIQAKIMYGQIKRHIDIAQILVNRQQTFLLSGNWMNMVKLTILEVAGDFPDWGEKTVRDSIHSLSFKFNGKVLPADALLSASKVNGLCKQIKEIQTVLPNAGAPLLVKALNEQGLNVSQRMVGNALKKIAKYEARQLA